MPDYRFLLANGRTLVLEGDTPPTHEDAVQAANESGVELAPDTGPEMADAGGEVEQPFTPTSSTAAPIDELPPQPSDDTITPGILASSGVLVKKAADVAPRAIHKTGQLLANGKGRVVKGLGAAIGASTGAGAGAAVGGPITAFGGASLGADAGRTLARKTLVPAQHRVGNLLKLIGESGFPEEIYAGQGAKTVARRASQFGLKKIIPGVGNALMAADVAKFLYGRVKGIPQAIRDNPNMLAASPGYQTPEDEAMIKALLEREDNGR